jgi:DNA-binding protein HU-beta
MNRSQFVEILAKRTNLPKNKCNLVLEELRNSILEICSKGEPVSIRNFGKFSLQERKSRRLLNPQTKRYYFCKPKKILLFKGFDNFKYAVN